MMATLPRDRAADIRHPETIGLFVWSINTSDCVHKLGLSHRSEYHWDIGLKSIGQSALEFQSRTINRHIFDSEVDGWMDGWITIVKG
jgi:hypothetical protein